MQEMCSAWWQLEEPQANQISTSGLSEADLPACCYLTLSFLLYFISKLVTHTHTCNRLQIYSSMLLQHLHLLFPYHNQHTHIYINYIYICMQIVFGMSVAPWCTPSPNQKRTIKEDTFFFLFLDRSSSTAHVAPGSLSSSQSLGNLLFCNLWLHFIILFLFHWCSTQTLMIPSLKLVNIDVNRQNCIKATFSVQFCRIHAIALIPVAISIWIECWWHARALYYCLVQAAGFVSGFYGYHVARQS